MIPCPRCDGCFRASLPIVLAEIFMWTYLYNSYNYLERPLLSALKTWMYPNLDLDSYRCEYFGHVFFSPKITMMSNAQWTMDQPMDLNPMFIFWRKISSMCCYVPNFISAWKWQNWPCFKLCDMWKIRKLSQLWFSWRWMQNWLCEHLDLLLHMFA
jgi:hypothetical protein